MKKTLMTLVLLTLIVSSCKESDSEKLAKSIKFDTLIAHFKKEAFYKDTFKFPTIYEDPRFKVEISNNPVPFIISEIMADNPFKGKSPISYSVIYNNTLVALFENGIFLCYSIPTFERDYRLEKILNTKRFQYHWILDRKLLAISDGCYFIVNSQNRWEEYKGHIPFKMQPILFEDDKYIVFSSCFGEWGGYVYFYNKFTKKVFCAQAQCANTVYRNGDRYFVLSNLMGGSHFDQIIDVEKLPEIEETEIGINIEMLENLDSTSDKKKYWLRHEIFSKKLNDTTNIINKFHSFRPEVISSFNYNGKVLYIVNYFFETFLAEIVNNTLSIVNPLFNDDLNLYDPLTSSYKVGVLINYTDYNYRIVGNEIRPVNIEKRFLLVYKNQIIKFMWNKYN